MIEKLFPLKFPPGIQNNGTTYLSKGRWYLGNCVRFFQGNIQPIGGWVQRTLTGASIQGTVNAAIAWQANNGNSYLAIGTTSNLYLVANRTQVYDITPTNVIADGLTHVWQLETFGSYLVATFNRSESLSAPTNMYYWAGTIGAIAVPVQVTYASPSAVFGIVVTPERFLVALRCADVGASTNAGIYAIPSNRVD